MSPTAYHTQSILTERASRAARGADLRKHWRTVVRILAARGAGFVRISAGKKPQDKGWQKTPANERAALAHLASGLNVGLATGTGAPLKLYAFDMDQDAARGYDCDALEGSLTVARENAPNKAKFIFACADELPNRKHKINGIMRTELLGIASTGGYSNCVIAGIHSSGAPIRWTGHHIAVLDAAVVAELWRDWTGQDLIRKPAPRPARTHTAPAAELATVADALDHIDPWAIDYEQWIAVLAALKHDYGDDALDLAIDWGDGAPGEVEGKWATFTGDHPNPATTGTIFHLAEANGWDRPRDPDPLPEGAERTPAGGVCIKRTEPEPAQPSPPAPAISPAVLRACRDILTGPEAAPILARIGKRRETWRDKLIQLLAVAEAKASWAFDADQRWLGEQLGVSKTAAGNNMRALDAAGLCIWRHGATKDADGGRPPMRLDLAPLAVALLGEQPSLKLPNLQKGFGNLTHGSERVDVWATYAGNAPLADATRRTLYRHAMTRQTAPTVLVRPMTAADLTVLDFAQTVGAFTRAEAVAAKGMTAGSAAAATRRLVQLGVLTVEKEGRTNVYTLIDGWTDRLRMLLPDMYTWGARLRLICYNYLDRIRYLDARLKQTTDPKLRNRLKDARGRIARARNRWVAQATRAGAYGLPAAEVRA